MKKWFKKSIAVLLSVIIMASLLSVCPINVNALSNTEIQSKLVDILYGDGGGYVSSDFDGYTTTSGRHEGIDFIRYKGAPVHSLINGTVIRVYNSSSSSTLSTLAIYDEQNNKSVIYLHTANICVSAGDSVSQGQLVAYESDRGISGVPHTHVEVRYGRQGYASKSVSDPVLDNPNPYSYWEIVVHNGSNHNPIGSWDSISSGGIRRIRVTGWAYDLDDPNASLDIHVYVDEKFVISGKADFKSTESRFTT